MTALPLARLETRPIRIPQYRNERIRKFALWFADNDAAIAGYFNALKPYCEEGVEPLVDYWTFSVLQHEREELKLYESAAGTPSGAVLTCRLPTWACRQLLTAGVGDVEVIDDGGSL